jgi:hypothetical protein
MIEERGGLRERLNRVRMGRIVLRSANARRLPGGEGHHPEIFEAICRVAAAVAKFEE